MKRSDHYASGGKDCPLGGVILAMVATCTLGSNPLPAEG